MRIRELDGLRALAALAVIDAHYFSWIPFSGGQFGWLGVDLFFVLSGFLITSILVDLKPSPDYFRIFYARRAFRIFPPYFFVLSIYLAYSIAIHRPGSADLWARYFLYYAGLLFTISESHLGQFAEEGLFVLWSLSVEEIFYTVWAPAVRYIDRRRFALLPAVVIAAAPIARWLLHGHMPSAFFTLYCRMDGLAFGALVAIVVHARRVGPGGPNSADRFWDRACVALGVLLAIVLAVSGGDFEHSRIAIPGLTVADAFFALLVYHIVRHSGQPAILLRLLRSKTLCSIGMVSYSVYLVHCPMLFVSASICAPLHLSRRPNAICLDALALVLTFAMAYAMWYGFESRALRLKDRLFPSHAAPRAFHSAELGVVDGRAEA